MAYGRSFRPSSAVSTFNHLLRRRLSPFPSFHLLHAGDDAETPSPSAPTAPSSRSPSHPSISHLLGSSSVRFNRSPPSLTGLPGFALPLGLHPSLGSKSYSSSPSVGGGSEGVEYMKDVADVITDAAAEASVVVAPVANEVAIAAADSFPPVAALQYFIDGVHNLFGVNWWVAIALTTLFIRSATVPLIVNQLKSTMKLSEMRPELEAIKQDMAITMDPALAQEQQQRVKELFKKHGVTPFTPLKGLLIQGPIFISFFMAISNMVEKVPSFKSGGTLWFTDLTTPDTLYILPVLTALTFLLTVELNMQDGLEGNPIAGKMKNFSRILAVATVPFTMGFPKAIFCYWITSNFFSLCYGAAIKRPPVRKFLNLPPVVPPPPVTEKLSFPLSGGPKQAPPASSPSPAVQQPQLYEKKISSNAVLSQRLRSLEKSVKGKHKSKRR
ncbi:Mitochondrial inner membrane protein OXA1-like [Acorus calamus]|uniref:Mitochondrial inner membrane protein OXA1-like n=1 Tax=Acorus calamus TaxID=4465 RepID=A0AAV9CR58_ACOCL|nr:Mitochondrial inner membrane protein OXA1-like [Acorus calamus]